jgi:hypothetical protein
MICSKFRFQSRHDLNHQPSLFSCTSTAREKLIMYIFIWVGLHVICAMKIEEWRHFIFLSQFASRSYSKSRTRGTPSVNLIIFLKMGESSLNYYAVANSLLFNPSSTYWWTKCNLLTSKVIKQSKVDQGMSIYQRFSPIQGAMKTPLKMYQCNELQ